MTLFDYKETKKTDNQVEVFYLYGDQTPAYELGCLLAQDMFAERGMRVFRASASEKGFMNNYDGQECIFLTGLIEQYMELREMYLLLTAMKVPEAPSVDLRNLRAIIITARVTPLDWTCWRSSYWYDMFDCCEIIDHFFEVRCKEDNQADITEYQYTKAHDLQKVTSHDNVNLNFCSLLQSLDSTEYFENLTIREGLDGSEADKDAFMAELSKHSFIDQRKIGAIFAAHHCYIPVEAAYDYLKKIDSYFYLPWIHNFSELGCYYIYDFPDNASVQEYALYFDFGKFAHNIYYSGIDEDHYPNCYFTNYGFVGGFDPWKFHKYF